LRFSRKVFTLLDVTIRSRVPFSVKLFVFDWDGTLQDSAEGTLRAYETIFDEAGIPLQRADFLATYSPDWYRTYEALGLPREKFEWADGRWLELFSQFPRQLLPRVSETLRALREKGYQVALLTAAAASRLHRELEEYKIGGLFHHVRTMDQYSVRKPDPRALLSLLVESETAPHEAIYVGDAVEDIQMGRGAGTYTLAVPSAFVSKDTLITAQPDFLVERLAGILEILPKKTVSKGAR
jgi:phosphoglycolate phosphatase